MVGLIQLVVRGEAFRSRAAAVSCLEQDPEKWVPVFPRDKR
jgi:hypothetical protein